MIHARKSRRYFPEKVTETHGGAGTVYRGLRRAITTWRCVTVAGGRRYVIASYILVSTREPQIPMTYGYRFTNPPPASPKILIARKRSPRKVGTVQTPLSASGQRYFITSAFRARWPRFHSVCKIEDNLSLSLSRSSLETRRRTIAVGLFNNKNLLIATEW